MKKGSPLTVHSHNKIMHSCLANPSVNHLPQHLTTPFVTHMPLRPSMHHTHLPPRPPMQLTHLPLAFEFASVG